MFRDSTDAKMILKKLVSIVISVQYLHFRSLDRPLKFTTAIEAKLSKVGPGLQNRKIAFIYRDLVLHALPCAVMQFVTLGPLTLQSFCHIYTTFDSLRSK